MPGILRTAASRVAPVLRGHTFTQTANLYSKPPKEKIGIVESTIGMTALTAAVIGPSGWILAHLEDYRNKN